MRALLKEKCLSPSTSTGDTISRAQSYTLGDTSNFPTALRKLLAKVEATPHELCHAESSIRG